jgi:hypothetical protein
MKIFLAIAWLLLLLWIYLNDSPDKAAAGPLLEDRKSVSLLIWNGRTILPGINGPIVNFKLLSVFFYIPSQLSCHYAKVES